MDIARAAPSKRRRNVIIGAALAAGALISVGISRLEPASPSVERSALWFDVVKRGEMKREVHASGTLVPEHIRIIAAVTAGRIEQLPVRPGDKVTPEAVIVDLSNPDVQLQALQAEQAVTQSRSALAELRTQLVQQRLAQEGAIAALVTQSQKARRDVGVQEELDRRGLAVKNELETARDAAAELTARIALERQRLDEMKRSATEQIALDEEQVARLQAIVGANRTRVSSMRVVAGETGVLQTLGNPPLEVGQWVNSGFELARVAQPGRLKAVLRVAESEAKDVTVGQRASIDTRNGVVVGHVTRADPSSQSGTVTVEVALDGALPPGTRSDLSVDGTIEIERLGDVLHVARPAEGAEDRTIGVFRVEPNSGHADRVKVKFGRASVSTIQILQGLVAGDSIIVSDMSAWDNVSRVKIK